jgi:hypothetical protein
MRVFIIGLPENGCDIVSKALCQELEMPYIDACSWVQHIFRDKKTDEHEQQYQELFDEFLTEKLKIDSDLYLNHITSSLQIYQNNAIISGLHSPREFVKLFDYTKDIVIFLNRIDTDSVKEEYSIGISVIRDYCYYLASSKLLTRDKWIEINYKLLGEESDFVKSLGSKNSIFLVKNIKKAIEVLISLLKTT